LIGAGSLRAGASRQIVYGVLIVAMPFVYGRERAARQRRPSGGGAKRGDATRISFP
jgi:hypothetical protein